MKKVMLTIAVVAFIMAGAVTINTVDAKTIDSSVYDDPPKKASKSKKSCADMKSGKSCCSKKSAKECKDTGETKSTSATKETKKESPDKK